MPDSDGAWDRRRELADAEKRGRMTEALENVVAKLGDVSEKYDTVLTVQVKQGKAIARLQAVRTLMMIMILAAWGAIGRLLGIGK